MFAIELILVFLLVYALTGLYRSLASNFNLIDLPNHRSSHQVPTPRGAGIVFASVSVAITYVLYANDHLSKMEWYIFGLLGALMALLGFSDDKFSLQSKLRLAVQVALSLVCAMIFTHTLPLHFPILLLVFVGFVLVFTVNTFNFMDGSDGIAALQALSVTFFLALFAIFEKAYGFGMLMGFISSSIAAFFVWNRPKAKVFMGDAGSYYLGWILGLALLFSVFHLHLPWPCAVLCYVVFGFDTLVTLIRRKRRHENIFSPHRKHLYQRLIQYGWSHAKVLTYFAGLQCVMLLLATMAAVFKASSIWFLWIGLIPCIGIYRCVERFSPME